MEGEPGTAQVAFGVLPGQVVDPGGLGVGQGDGREICRAGQSGNGRVDDGAGMYLQVSGVYRVAGGVRGPGRPRDGDGVVSAGQEVAEGDDAELGQGGQEGVPVEGLPGAGLGLVPAECVLPAFETGFD